MLKDTQEVCQIILLNTYLVKYSNPDLLISLNDELKYKSKVGLEIEKSIAQKMISNEKIKIATASHIGSLTNVMQNLIKKEKIDLVAMGKDSGKLISSVENMLKSQNLCPMLVTKIEELKIPAG